MLANSKSLPVYFSVYIRGNIVIKPVMISDNGKIYDIDAVEANLIYRRFPLNGVTSYTRLYPILDIGKYL